jgi:DNA-binding NarL/FixJ family response regulator
MLEPSGTLFVRVVGKCGAYPERLIRAIGDESGFSLICGWPGEELRDDQLTPEKKNPRVVVYDAATSDRSAIEDVRSLRALEPHSSLVVVGQQVEPKFILDCIAAGASAYVGGTLLHYIGQECIAAIRSVARGQGYYCPATAQALAYRQGAVSSRRAPIWVDPSASAHGNAPHFATTAAALAAAFRPATTTSSAARSTTSPVSRESLTPREAEVLRLVAEGMSTAEIARFLAISGKTVEGHRGRIMAKLKVHNVAGLVRYAIRVGMIAA